MKIKKQTRIIGIAGASEEELMSIAYQILMDNKGQVIEIIMHPDEISYTAVKVED